MRAFSNYFINWYGVKKVTIGTVKRTAYKAFGLKILSEIPLPELINSYEEDKQVDIFIKISTFSDNWSRLVHEKGNFVVYEDMVMFMVPKVALFSIQDGSNIIVSPLGEADLDKIRLYILGTCIGVILLQRKVLPLHGSAVNINGKAYGFIGNSGVGKSTLASAFISKGFQLLSDDVIAVDISKENIPFVMPSYPQQKLWQESLNEFGMETMNYRPLFDRETKYSIPVNSSYISDPLPLGGVFELVMTDHEHIEIITIKGLERFQLVFRQTFRKSLINRMRIDEWHFMFSSNIINQIGMFQVKRPTSRFTAHELVSNILDHIN
jgi:hypothetical protein